MPDPRHNLIRRTEKVLRDAAGICWRAQLMSVSQALKKVADAWKPYLDSHPVQMVQPKRPRGRPKLPEVVRHNPNPYQKGGRLEWFAQNRKRNNERTSR